MVNKFNNILTARDGIDVEDGSGNPVPANHIESQTAATSTSLDFTTGIDSSCDIYRLLAVGMVPANDGVNLRVRVSNDGGSTYQSASTDYGWTWEARRFDGSSGTTSDNALQQSSALISNAAGNAATEGVYLSDTYVCLPTNSSFYTLFLTESIVLDDSGEMYRAYIGGWYNTAESNDALRVKFLSGDITSGTVHLMRVV